MEVQKTNEFESIKNHESAGGAIGFQLPNKDDASIQGSTHSNQCNTPQQDNFNNLASEVRRLQKMLTERLPQGNEMNQQDKEAGVIKKSNDNTGYKFGSANRT